MNPSELPPKRPVQNEPKAFDLLSPVDNPAGWIRQTAVEAVQKLVVLKEERRKRIIRISQNASINWDDDHNEEVGKLIHSIKRRPFYVVSKLRRTLHGVTWLLGEWAKVRMSVESFQGFNLGTQDMAANLLGVPIEHKSFGLAVEPPYDEWPAGMTKGKDVWLWAVDQQIQALTDKLPMLEKFDAEDKTRALNGEPMLTDKELNRLDLAIRWQEKTLLWVAHTSRPSPHVDGLSKVRAVRNEPNSEPSDLDSQETTEAKPAKAAKSPRPPFQSPSGPAQPKRSAAAPDAESTSPLPPTSASS